VIRDVAAQTWASGIQEEKREGSIYTVCVQLFLVQLNVY